MPALQMEILNLAIELAASEAASAGFSQITTGHLVIALSRMTDESTSTSRDTSSELSREFERLGIEPRVFRRRLRAVLGRGDGFLQGTVMHRTDGCKSVFMDALDSNGNSGTDVSLASLLCAAFRSLSNDHMQSKSSASNAHNIPFEL